MRPATRLLASAATPKSGLSPPPMALLPPIPLYRRLLRAHRKFLPSDMRLLGDEYIKAEFRAHRKIGFLSEWQLYAQKIEGDAWVGEKLDPVTVAKMNDQQVGQLYELMMAIKKHCQDTGKDPDNGNET
ncbi:acn9 family domain containing protein [Niveomyces insectorum RCEF 264]|uniref:Succinate dehydrogenase assembly factor 3 n=1 Tax=Niveomyces insectorum RCEF 264 TaxID=1081102 RepID=A0A162LC20_9HYPO|nr:acn9 family domain containing protein [Niveomyces insectorum RCEF 264]